MSKQYSYKLYEYDEAITSYGTLETKPPIKKTLDITNFIDNTAKNFHTTPSSSSLCLSTKPRLLSLIIDESGSLLYNDYNKERIDLYRKLLQNLNMGYPDETKINLIGYGGLQIKSDLFLTSNNLESSTTSFNDLKTSIFSDSVYDLAGIRVVRKSSGYPINPYDGTIVADGIFDNIKDENLNEDTDYYYSIFTYNKYDQFSEGKQVKFSTHEKTLPNGINSFIATPRILPGAERDDNTQIILNFLEKYGSVLYDSSGNNNHVSLTNSMDEDQFWIGSTISSDEDKYKVYVGGKFSGENYIETVSSGDFGISNNGDKTASIWIYRNSSSSEQVVFSIEDNITWQYQLSIDVLGRVHIFSNGGIINTYSSSIINEKEWTMITIVMSNSGGNLNSQIYINGMYDSESISAYPAVINDPFIRIGGSDLNGNNFIGSVSNFSYHNISRDIIYVQNLYIQESKIFFEDETAKNKEQVDNGQREVLLQWTINDDFNYTNGTVRIVKKYNSIPSNYDDGEIVLDDPATSGSFAFVDSNNFINGGIFNYRFFTVNSLGNQCGNSEARIVPVFIPNSLNNTIDTTLPAVVADITHGNQKNKIVWNNVVNARVKGVKIYYSTSDYPSINSERKVADQWNSESDPLFSGKLAIDTTETSYIHRTTLYEKKDDEELPDEIYVPLENGTTYYYTIVSYDRIGNISEPFYIKATPSSVDNTIFIPDDVYDVWSELANKTSISLHWKSPTSKTRYIKLWFGQPALFYLGIFDIFGASVNNLSGFDITVQQSITRKDQTATTENEYLLKISSNENGVLKGNIIHTLDTSLLSSTEKYYFLLSPFYNIANPESTSSNIFEYRLPEFVVEYQNPLSISAVNLLNKKIEAVGTSLASSLDQDNENAGRPCEKRFCGKGINKNKINLINGGYIGSKEPYICRIFVTYQNESIPDGTPITTNIYKYGTKTSPEYVTINSGPYVTSTAFYDGLTEVGTPSENTKKYSYVDIYMNSPVLPEMIDIVASFTYEGISSSVTHTVLWASTLKFQLDVSRPKADGIDTTEQIASIYFVDPDDYDNIQKRKPIPDGTIVKWGIEYGEFWKERPFYSLDVSSGRFSGVYSRTKNGIARNVWFGPVSNIENHVKTFICGNEPDSCCIGEEYRITSQVIIENETIKVGKWIGYSCDDITAEKTTYSRILMDAAPEQTGENPHYFAYADGEEMIHLEIASDPNNSSMSASDCFKKCIEYLNGEIVPLPCNQIVSLYTGGLDQQKIDEKKYSEAGIEIIWNAEFDVDPYTGEKTLLPGYSILTPTISALSKTEHIANIPIKGETTDVYLRMNKFVGAENNPVRCKEEDSISVSSLITSGIDGVSPCEAQSLCYNLGDCRTKYWKYNKVQEISCSSSIIYNNKILTMNGGGGLSNGLPPVLVGFKEPLNIKYVDVRINGINGQKATDIVADGITRHTFVIDVTFSGKPVPDGTPVEFRIVNTSSSDNVDLIILSSNVVYTHLTYDPIFDPLQQYNARSLAYVDLEPVGDVEFGVVIQAICRYDKRGDAIREEKDSVSISNFPDVPITETETDPQSPPEPRKVQVYSNEIIIYDIDSDTYWTDEFSTDSLVESRAGHFSAIIGNSIGTGYVSESGSDIVPKIYLIGGFNGNKILSSTEIYEIGPQISYLSSPMITPRSFGQTAVIGDNIYCIGGIEYDQILKRFSVSRKIEIFNTITNTWNSSLTIMPDNYGVAFGKAITNGNYIYVLCGCTTLSGDSEAGTLNDKIIRYNTVSDEWDIINVENIDQYTRIAPFCFVYDNKIYVDGGCVPKDTSYLKNELKTYIDFKIAEFTAFVYSSSYYVNQKGFNIEELIVAERERLLKEEIEVSPFHYPETGFIFDIQSSSISELDEQWNYHPKSRSRGSCVFDETSGKAFFIGGSNNNSVTSKNNESISIAGNYSKNTSLLRGRTLMGADLFNRQIYITGGFTSGHSENWASIESSIFPSIVEAKGIQTTNLMITLRDDAGEIIDKDIRILVRGNLKIPGITERIAAATVENATARLVSQTNSNITKLKQYLQNMQNPNSDEFQFGSSRKLSEDLVLFPVLLTKSDFIIHGTGITTLLPRSEDPVSNIEVLSRSLSDGRQSIRDSIKTDASGTTVVDQVNALETVLSSISDKIIIESEQVRNLYEIELQITILDEKYFGQTVCTYDLSTLNSLYTKINSTIKNEEEYQSRTVSNISERDELINNNYSSVFNNSDYSRSAQSLSSKSLFGIVPIIRKQANCPTVKYFNNVDWLPQIFEYVSENSGTILSALTGLETISDNIPFGSSNLYDALYKASDLMTDESFVGIEKNIFINSDNEENTSSYTLDDTIDQINSIDGDKKVPVIYTILNTSFPPTVSSNLIQSQSGIVETLTIETGGHSAVLNDSRFLSSVLNYILNISGSFGYGLYRKLVDFKETCSITKLSTVYSLYENTEGYIRYRHSTDGRAWSGWTENYDANNDILIENLKTRYIEFEIILKSGFVDDPEDPYIAVGIPCALKISWEYSAAREDFIFLNTENTLGNVQQVETAITGNFPYATSANFGTASSDSSDWGEFETEQRPAINESKKTILLDRQDSTLAEGSIISREELTTKDGIVFTSIYGPWSETSAVLIFEKDSNGNDVLISTEKYKLYPISGKIVMNTGYDISKNFYMSVTNENKLRVGVKLSNSNHEETISIEGIGYIYSENSIREPSLSQVPPTANKVVISPQTPMVSSDISVSYNFVDLNRNEEVGSLIKWFKNGTPLLEINNKTSWNNEDLLITNRLKPDDVLTVSVTPSDGIDYGSEAFSSPIKVVASPPVAINATIVPTRNGLINSRTDTGSVLTVKYEFISPDTGVTAIEEGTLISWYVNGNLYKQSTYSLGDDQTIKKSLYPFDKVLATDKDGKPTEIVNDSIIYDIGNNLYAEVVPKTKTITGDLIRTATTTIQNSLVVVKTLKIEPANPSTTSTLSLLLELDDPDFILSSQTNQSEIQWYKSTDGINFVEVTSLKNQLFAPPALLVAGDLWKVRVIGYDGVEFSQPVSSSPSRILPA